MLKFIAGAAITSVAVMAAGAANAQSWGVYVGNGAGYYGNYDGYNGDRGRAGLICSGRRGQSLEAMVRHEEDEGDIEEDTADRMLSVIDRLEDQQGEACEDRDWRQIRNIAYRYDRIERWIENEAHGD